MPLLSSFQIALVADETKEMFCEAESAIKPYLKILANFLHGGKHAVNKVEQILWYDYERSMFMMVVTSGTHWQWGECMRMQQSMAGVNEIEKGWEALPYKTVLPHTRNRNEICR